MHDFRCSNADDMFCELLAEKTRYYKENPKGVSGMCKLMEDRVIDTKIQIALNMILKGKYSLEEIAEMTELTLSDVEEISKQLAASKVQ